jgi:hypothetical protein
VVLQAGRHVLDKPSHFFAGNLSAGMELLKLRDVCSLTADNVQLKFDAALSLRVSDPVKAVTMLCRGSFDMGTLLQTIKDKADLVLNSSIGQHRFNQAFSATSRQAIPTKPQFETDLLLDAQPGAMVATPAVSSAAAAAALTPAAGGVRAPNSGAADSDPTAPSAGGPPATSSFKDAIHAVFMRDFRCGAAGLRRCCCRRAPPRTRVCAVQQLSHPRPPPRLPASRL